MRRMSLTLGLKKRVLARLGHVHGAAQSNDAAGLLRPDREGLTQIEAAYLERHPQGMQRRTDATRWVGGLVLQNHHWRLARWLVSSPI